MAMTEEQERKLAIIDEKLKEKGVTMTPAQKAVLVSKGSAMMNLMSGETGASTKMPKDPNPDKEAGPAKDLPNFPRDLAQNPEQKRQKEECEMFRCTKRLIRCETPLFNTQNIKKLYPELWIR